MFGPEWKSESTGCTPSISSKFMTMKLVNAYF